MISPESVWSDVQQIRNQAPLIHNITNFVVMNTTANALLAIGASPVMAHAVEEAAEMAGLASALVLNIGTLSGPWIEAMRLAGRAARERGIPIVLDPVGAGATRYRTETARALLDELAPTVVRGNASEIRALVLEEAGTRGVDSAHASEDAADAGADLASRHRCVVVVSGATDFVLDGASAIRIHNGHPLMPRVTGLGCVATALVGAFAAVNPSPLMAAAHAMAVMGIAGEIAAEKAEGPGSFFVAFLDALHNLDHSAIARRLRAEG